MITEKVPESAASVNFLGRLHTAWQFCASALAGTRLDGYSLLLKIIEMKSDTRNGRKCELAECTARMTK